MAVLGVPVIELARVFLDFEMEILTRINLFLDLLLTGAENERFGPVEIQRQ